MRRIFYIVLLTLFCWGCVTHAVIETPLKGSLENPVLCDMPLGERDYLKRLRGPHDERIEYDYIEATLGPGGKILDIFRIKNPLARKQTQSLGDAIADFFREKPETPIYFYIYMDMYNPGRRDHEAIKGYKLLTPEE